GVGLRSDIASGEGRTKLRVKRRGWIDCYRQFGPVFEFRAFAGEIHRLYAIGYVRRETVRWNVDPTKFLERSLVGIRPHARCCRGLIRDAHGKTNPVAKRHFCLASVC